MKILIVEDDNCIRDQLCITLNNAGYLADGVSSIAAFNAWSATHQHDLLIVDRQLPDGDGLQIAAINSLNRQTPVIVLSGLGGAHNRLKGMQANVDLYIEKPTSPAEILEAVDYVSRRNHSPSSAVEKQWCIKPSQQTLSAPCGTNFVLTKRELQLMLLLQHNAGTIISRLDVAKHLDFETDPGFSKRLEVSIRRLRNKIQTEIEDFPLITIYGSGITFSEKLVVEE